jgi:ferredoxin-like protein FixX
MTLSQLLKEVIPIISLIRELKQNKFNFNDDNPDVKCKAFKDNDGAYEMAMVPKLCPRTKHINIKYHHFQDAVECGNITIHKIDTKEQQADIFTKPLIESIFIYLRKLIKGW